MLPGTERWGALEVEKTVWQKVPPWLVGCAIALPAALFVVYVFLYILYPMVETAGERKARQQREAKAAEIKVLQAQDKTTLEAKKKEQREIAMRANKAALEERVAELVDRRIFSGLDDNYRVYGTGSVWSTLSEDEKYRGFHTFEV